MFSWISSQNSDTLPESELQIRLTASDERYKQLEALYFKVPVPIITCNELLTIVFANEASIKLFQSIQHALPVRADSIIGTNLEVLTDDKSALRQALKNAASAPVKIDSLLKDEHFEMIINCVLQTDNKPTYCITLARQTEMLERLSIGELYAGYLENAPTSIMVLDIKTFKIIYMNAMSMQTLKLIEQHLPIPINEIIGTNVDRFHKNPSMQRQLLSNPQNLPHNAVIKIGDQYFDMHISAYYGQDGTYQAALLSWGIISDIMKLVDHVKDAGEELGKHGIIVSDVAKVMATSVESTSIKASAVAAASEEASVNVTTVASATEELSSSINEISVQLEQLAGVASQAANEAKVADTTMQELVNAAQEINNVVKVIGDISAQIKLLALNATIEAARAGPAGRGFGVVASEVTNMVDQTSKATQQISEQVSAIQHATQAAVNAIRSIVQTVDQVNVSSSAIAAAVEEQGTVTQEIARNVAEAAAGTSEVSSNITLIMQNTSENTSTAKKMLETAQRLMSQAGQLNSAIEAFNQGQ